jgi:hypothetical protein
MDIKGKIIKSIEYWENVYFVKFFNAHPTFISYTSPLAEEIEQEWHRIEARKLYSNEPVALTNGNGEYVISYAEVDPHKGVGKMFKDNNIACRWEKDCGIWNSTWSTGGWVFQAKDQYDKAMVIVNELLAARKYSGVAWNWEYNNSQRWVGV